MKRSRFNEEQIIARLKEHEAGKPTADVCPPNEAPGRAHPQRDSSRDRMAPIIMSIFSILRPAHAVAGDRKITYAAAAARRPPHGDAIFPPGWPVTGIQSARPLRGCCGGRAAHPPLHAGAARRRLFLVGAAAPRKST